MTSWLARLLGWEAEIPAEERDAVLAYLAEEWKLTALQDSEAGRYNDAATKYGGGLVSGSPGLTELLSAAYRLSQVAAELVKRHADLGPVPDEAARTYWAWQGVYMQYQQWTSAVGAAYEGIGEGGVPSVHRVQELFRQMEKTRRHAQNEEGKLIKRLKLSGEDLRQLWKASEAKEWQAAIPIQEREAILAYLAKEMGLVEFQDSEIERYNSVAMKYAGATRLGSADFQELLSAAKRLSQVSAELVRRHSELDPAPDAALETYSAWQACYLAYEEWASAVVFSYEPHEVDTRAEAKRLQELLNAVELRMQEARAVTDVLRRRCQD